MGDQDVPEDPADDGRVLGQALLVGWQAVEPGGEDGLDRRGHLDLLDRPGQLPGAVCQTQDAAVDEHPDELLGEERVALGQPDDAFPEFRRQAARKQPVDQRARLARR